MRRLLTFKLACWPVLIAVAAAPVALAQQVDTFSLSDEQLKQAGWTEVQIQELRATAPQQKADENNSTELGYASVFDNYQPFDYLPDLDWISANKEVGKIGGWRAYTKMVQEAQKKERENEGGKK